MAKRKDLNYYKSLNYKVELFYDDADRVWYAEFPELAGCLTHGAMQQEALANSIAVKDEWLETAFETGRAIPEPRAEIEYSGKFLLRVPKSLHKDLAEEAEMEGTSINRFAIRILSQEIERRKTMKTVTASITTAVYNLVGRSFSAAMSNRLVGVWSFPLRLGEAGYALGYRGVGTRTEEESVDTSDRNLGTKFSINAE